MAGAQTLREVKYTGNVLVQTTLRRVHVTIFAVEKQ